MFERRRSFRNRTWLSCNFMTSIPPPLPPKDAIFRAAIIPKQEFRKRSIQYFVRVRPPLMSELARSNAETCVQVLRASKSIRILPGNEEYHFDAVFGTEDGQKKLNDATVNGMIETSLMQGTNSCVVLTGPAGSGKSYTAMGPSMQPTHDQFGIVQRIAIQLLAHGNLITIYFSHVALSGSNIRDLLAEPDTQTTSQNPNGSLGGMSKRVVVTLEDVSDYIRLSIRNKSKDTSMLTFHIQKTDAVEKTSTKFNVGVLIHSDGELLELCRALISDGLRNASVSSANALGLGCFEQVAVIGCLGPVKTESLGSQLQAIRALQSVKLHFSQKKSADESFNSFENPVVTASAHLPWWRSVFQNIKKFFPLKTKVGPSADG